MPLLPALPGELPAPLTDSTHGPLDFVFVTGDAYVDHPGFAAALIGRLLESRGYSVGILARPDPDDPAAFRLLGRPRLAFLVSAGALDSMVSSYTANRKPRSEDDYAPGGRPELCLRADGSIGVGIKGRKNARPDRAVIAYAGRCREAFAKSGGAGGSVPVIIGGIEASLRRFAHYDYWSDSVRKSILLDSKADLLVYGMGERAIVEAARRLASLGEGRAPNADAALGGAALGGAAREALRGIPGTCSWFGSAPDLDPDSYVALASWEEASSDPAAFNESFRLVWRNAEARSGRRLVERSEGRFVVQEPPALPLAGRELDELYELPYTREAHPMYEAFAKKDAAEHGGRPTAERTVPAVAEIRFSLVANRGCFGACAFCAIALHQGRTVTARTIPSLVRETQSLVATRGFKGYIHDLGGPTANFFRPACPKMEKSGACPDRRCLSPEPCPAARPDHRDWIAALRAVRSVPGVKKAFVRSGIRFDWLMLDQTSGEEALAEVVDHHVSGQLKVAPEHVSDAVLDLMGKPRRAVYAAFVKRYAELNRRAGLRQYIVPYFISAHPGAGLAEAVELAEYLRDSGFVPDQVQDFYPTPGTLATAIYHTGFDPESGMAVHVARGDRERAMQRALLQFRKPENRELVREALGLAGRRDLIGRGPSCLVQ
ncbi:MAG TPA: YgiQ family radical SAM protein [Rectinemataceae bacterium]|nr:YgiQ family radical SAM protein [Rectinemataceae bacterium]